MIYEDDNLIKIGGVVLPGIVKSLEVKTDAKVEEQEVEGSSSKPKQATGFEDGKVTIELSLEDSPEQTKEEKLEIIQNIFRQPGQSLPSVYDIVSELTDIRNISSVILKNMSSKYTNKKTEITVSLEVWEYVEMTIAASGGSSSGSSSDYSNLNSDYANYLMNDRGNAPKQSNKTDYTLSEDQWTEQEERERLEQMPF